MSDIERQDADYSCPTEDEITAFALSAGTASALQDTGILGTPAAPPQFVSFGCDVAFYLTFSKTAGTAAVTDPVIASVAGSSRTFGPYQPGIYSLRADLRRRYFKVISASAGTFRWYLSSGPGVL